MEEKFLMGKDDFLKRNSITKIKPTFISSKLKTSLIKLAIQQGVSFYKEFLNLEHKKFDIDSLSREYEDVLQQAYSLGLFQNGGIIEKDHLNLWCLGKVLSPNLYIESGVFIGSSLHAFVTNRNIEHIIAIDPNLEKLKIPEQYLTNVKLIQEYDFSQLLIEDLSSNSLVYFDDHINTAKRIIQSSKKGIRYIIFDDSTGFEGISQRLYPAIPTIPMIVNWSVLEKNEYIEWSWEEQNKSKSNDVNSIRRIRLDITQTLIDQCKEANSMIRRYAKIPDLGNFLPPRFPAKTADSSKYIIELVN